MVFVFCTLICYEHLIQDKLWHSLLLFLNLLNLIIIHKIMNNKMEAKAQHILLDFEIGNVISGTVTVLCKQVLYDVTLIFPQASERNIVP